MKESQFLEDKMINQRMVRSENKEITSVNIRSRVSCRGETDLRIDDTSC